MVITFRELLLSDNHFLSEVLVSAFDSDSELAFGDGVKLGPRGYDDGSLAKRIMADNVLIKLVILKDNQECGVLIYSEGDRNEIHYFCLASEYINQAIGSEAWQSFEENISGSWQLETPDFSLRNHHFYQKNGFKKIGEKVYDKESKSFVFEKIVK